MKYAPSALIGMMSRSQGSTTASHNRYGAYFRGRTIPVNPNTPIQAAQRVIMAGLSAGWRALTATQRASWTALGSSMSRLDTLGQSYSLSGLQAYTSVNRNLIFIGLAALSAAPVLTAPTTLLSVTLTATQ